jgi:hypothetical protein
MEPVVVVVVPAVMLDLRIKIGEDGPFLCRDVVCRDVEMMIACFDAKLLHIACKTVTYCCVNSFYCMQNYCILLC